MIDEITNVGPFIRELVTLAFPDCKVDSRIWNDKSSRWRRITVSYTRSKWIPSDLDMYKDQIIINRLMKEIFDDKFKRMKTSIRRDTRLNRRRYQIRIPYDICDTMLTDKDIQLRLKRNLIVKEIMK